MGREALIAALRAQAAADEDALWRDARAQAEAYRCELAQALEQRQAREQEAAIARDRQLGEDASASARRRAAGLRAQAALDLADRLHRLAVAELPVLRDAGAVELFTDLVRELPARKWHRVRVNPGDEARARELLPDAEITGDPGISGGIEVETGDGKVRVSNTLETRLENAWPDILPGLVEQLYAEPNVQRTAS